MPRHNRRRREERPSRPSAAAQRTESWRGGHYVVRTVNGTAAAKSYRCPGCDQLIGIWTPHLVVWPDSDADAEHRRHWHTACWAARERRGPAVQRSRSAPRY